jgi:hypothetical protein
VIERAGIVGGESIVYGPDKKTEYLRRTLQAGEGIFQADKGSELWHYVTSIQGGSGDAPPITGIAALLASTSTFSERAVRANIPSDTPGIVGREERRLRG